MSDFTLKDINPYIRYVNNYKPGYSYVETERIIYDYELMYVMEGETVLNFGGADYVLRKGDVFYLKPFVKNHITVDEKKGFRTHCIHFDWTVPLPEVDFSADEYYMHSVVSEDHEERLARLLQRETPEPAELAAAGHISAPENEKLAELFARCYYNFSVGDTVHMLKAKAEFYEIAACLAELTGACGERKYVHPKLVGAINYLKENYKGDIRVPYLADKCGLSPKYFGTLFKETTGRSVNAYVLGLRVGEAKDMLARTDMTVEEIAERTGFANQFYFSKCFKAETEMTPSEFRGKMSGWR